jgi:glycosyltransferase involved in cell wall biosynthesis
MLHLSTEYPFNLYVIDNGSVDGSRDFILKMEKEGLVFKHLFNENNLPLASAFTACFNNFKDEFGEFVMTAADDHTPPLFKPVDWLEMFVKKMKSDEKIGTINFKAVRQNYNSFQRKERPWIEQKIKENGGKLLEKFNHLQKLIYDR